MTQSTWPVRLGKIRNGLRTRYIPRINAGTILKDSLHFGLVEPWNFMYNPRPPSWGGNASTRSPILTAAS